MMRIASLVCAFFRLPIIAVIPYGHQYMQCVQYAIQRMAVLVQIVQGFTVNLWSVFQGSRHRMHGPFERVLEY
jgi:hypothetical protein